MVYIIIALSIFIGDYFIKNYIEKNKVLYKEEEILNGNIIINKYHNKGAMLNFLENKKSLVLTLSSVFIGIILVAFMMLLPRKNHKLTKLGLAFVIGGALSNIFDRKTKGYVIDYFSFKWLKKVVFNLSDLFIFLGSALILIKSLFEEKK